MKNIFKLADNGNIPIMYDRRKDPYKKNRTWDGTGQDLSRTLQDMVNGTDWDKDRKFTGYPSKLDQRSTGDPLPTNSEGGTDSAPDRPAATSGPTKFYDDDSPLGSLKQTQRFFSDSYKLDNQQGIHNMGSGSRVVFDKIRKRVRGIYG